ncbi:hypothetical protein [Leptospira interrogans]|uniref:hypothetical protein n=1 Tax=Leptospira interrogans TaxID=173 RepID=UPI0009E34D31|nr:hypothetical protein [Leptospira interrogans]
MGANETGYRFGILPYFSNIKELDYQNIVPNPSVKNLSMIKNFKEIKNKFKNNKSRQVWVRILK